MNAAEKLAIKSQIKSLKETVANLESLLSSDSPVKKEDKKEKEFVVVTSMSPEEEAELAHTLVTKGKFEDASKAAAVSVSYATHLYEGHDVPFLNTNKLCITLLSTTDEVIATTEVNKKVLKEYAPQLAYLGVFKKTPDHSATVVTLPL